MFIALACRAGPRPTTVRPTTLAPAHARPRTVTTIPLSPPVASSPATLPKTAKPPSHSGLQKSVLALYRAMLREARKRPASRPAIERLVRDGFRRRAGWPVRDVQAVESWLRRGEAQLTTLRSESVQAVGIVER